MRSGFVEIAEAVLIHNSRKMALAKNDNLIQTLSPYAPKKTFAPSVHEWSPHCRSHDFHSGAFRHSVEFSAKLVVVIADDHVGALAEWRNITQLLRRPLLGRCSRDFDVNDFAGLDVDHKEGEQWSKPNIVDLQEVAGPNRMVREKRLPALAHAAALADLRPACVSGSCVWRRRSRA